ncbi:MAG: NUDIX hydrolase [Caldilineaceae bacterium]|nr:NUDIX hydrolase [Caldilineaceae bacterium]
MTKPANDPQAWTTRATRTAFRNRWLGVEIDEVELPTGAVYEYTRLLPAGVGVAVIGFNAAGDVLLEREYRHGVGRVVWQLPGGLADSGEALCDAGLRELREETGHAPSAVNDETVRYLGSIWDNPGFGTAISHVYAAWGVTPVSDTRRDSAEFVTLHWVSPDWLKEAVRDGTIRDRVVVAAVGWLVLNNWLIG